MQISKRVQYTNKIKTTIDTTTKKVRLCKDWAIQKAKHKIDASSRADRAPEYNNCVGQVKEA